MKNSGGASYRRLAVSAFMPICVALVQGAFSNPLIIQANSPEDFFRAGRTHEQRMSELQQLRNLGANQRFGILYNMGGDGNNTTPFVGNGTSAINEEFMAQLSATVRAGNEIGMTFEVALFEEETARKPNSEQRKMLARATATALLGLGAVIDISEECPLHGSEVTELIDAILEVDPHAKVVVHNGVDGNQEDQLLRPLAEYGGIWGVSGQIWYPHEANAFIAKWHDSFPSVILTEVGEPLTGFPPNGNYAARRIAIYASVMSGGGIGIYYGMGHDIGDQDHNQWAQAFQQCTIAGEFAEVPCGSSWRPDLANGQPCLAANSNDEWRVYLSSGTGTINLPNGKYYVDRYSPVTRQETSEPYIATASNNRLSLNKPGGEPNGDRLVVVRTPARHALMGVLGHETPKDVNGDGLVDSADGW